MRIIKYIFIGVLFSLITTSSAFAQNDLPGEIMKAFKQGNSISLSNYFGDRVELSILNKEDIYSQSQAKQIMAKFFREFPPTAFSKKHAGGKPGARYVTGDLSTARGNFRVSFLLKKQGTRFIIHQLNIEKN